MAQGPEYDVLGRLPELSCYQLPPFDRYHQYFASAGIMTAMADTEPDELWNSWYIGESPSSSLLSSPTLLPSAPISLACSRDKSPTRGRHHASPGTSPRASRAVPSRRTLVTPSSSYSLFPSLQPPASPDGMPLAPRLARQRSESLLGRDRSRQPARPSASGPPPLRLITSGIAPCRPPTGKPKTLATSSSADSIPMLLVMAHSNRPGPDEDDISPTNTTFPFPPISPPSTSTCTSTASPAAPFSQRLGRPSLSSFHNFSFSKQSSFSSCFSSPSSSSSLSLPDTPDHTHGLSSRQRSSSTSTASTTPSTAKRQAFLLDENMRAQLARHGSASNPTPNTPNPFLNRPLPAVPAAERSYFDDDSDLDSPGEDDGDSQDGNTNVKGIARRVIKSLKDMSPASPGRSISGKTRKGSLASVSSSCAPGGNRDNRRQAMAGGSMSGRGGTSMNSRSGSQSSACSSASSPLSSASRRPSVSVSPLILDADATSTPAAVVPADNGCRQRDKRRAERSNREQEQQRRQQKTWWSRQGGMLLKMLSIRA